MLKILYFQQNRWKFEKNRANPLIIFEKESQNYEKPEKNYQNSRKYEKKSRKLFFLQNHKDNFITVPNCYMQILAIFFIEMWGGQIRHIIFENKSSVYSTNLFIILSFLHGSGKETASLNYDNSTDLIASAKKLIYAVISLNSKYE